MLSDFIMFQTLWTIIAQLLAEFNPSESFDPNSTHKKEEEKEETPNENLKSNNLIQLELGLSIEQLLSIILFILLLVMLRKKSTHS